MHREAAITPAAPIETPPVKDIPFRWTYIVLPATILFVSLVVAAFFYTRLTEQIAYHFSGGLPDRWLSRTAFIIWMVIPQALFTLLAFAVTKTILLSTRYLSVVSQVIKRLLPIMGNMLALPGLILFFTMLAAFLYNAYQVKLFSVWVFAVVVMVLGGILIGVLLFRARGQARRLYGNSQRE